MSKQSKRNSKAKRKAQKEKELLAKLAAEKVQRRENSNSVDVSKRAKRKATRNPNRKKLRKTIDNTIGIPNKPVVAEKPVVKEKPQTKEVPVEKNIEIERVPFDKIPFINKDVIDISDIPESQQEAAKRLIEDAYMRYLIISRELTQRYSKTFEGIPYDKQKSNEKMFSDHFDTIYVIEVALFGRSLNKDKIAKAHPIASMHPEDAYPEILMRTITATKEDNITLLAKPTLYTSIWGVAPREIIGTRFNAIKANIQALAKNHCMICDRFVPHTRETGDWIHTHEDYNLDKENNVYTLNQYIGICRQCHEFIHIGRLGMLLEEGQITKEYYDEVVAKGLALLKSIGINEKSSYNEGRIVPLYYGGQLFTNDRIYRGIGFSGLDHRNENADNDLERRLELFEENFHMLPTWSKQKNERLNYYTSRQYAKVFGKPKANKSS